MDAVLDALLSKQLANGKFFVGQKLRVIKILLYCLYTPSLIKAFCSELLLSYSLLCLMKIWGAALCGWAGPVSPLEVLTSFLVVYK